MKHKKVIAIIIFFCIVFFIIVARPISFYTAFLLEGYKMTNVEIIDSPEVVDDKHKVLLCIAEDKHGNYNSFIVSNTESYLWKIQERGIPSSETQDYSYINWFKWGIKDGEIIVTPHFTVNYLSNDPIEIIEKNIPSEFDYDFTVKGEYAVLDIYYTNYSYMKPFLEWSESEFHQFIRQ